MEGNNRGRRQPAALDKHEKHPDTLFYYLPESSNAKFQFPVCFRTKAHTHMDQRTLTWVSQGERRQLEEICLDSGQTITITR